MKLDPSKESYDNGEFWWVGHEYGGDGTPESDLIKANRFKVEIHGGVQDDEASYSYDDFALCELDDKFYLLQTSGCSCPSRCETWGVAAAGSLKDIKAYVLDPRVATYEVPFRQRAEFLAIIDRVSLAKYGKVL